MKKVWSKAIVMVMAALFVSVFSLNTSKAQGSVSLQVFYDELQPYGTWMQHRSYGYVWIPRVDREFTPYATNGYWINTEYGNTWVSDYSWGWAPFHYGRWFYDDFYGWIWVPDSEWAPAWVAWRSGGGYYGWAPLMPGFGINVSFSYYNRLPSHYWNFVPYRYITYRTVYNHCVPRQHVVNIINNTTIIANNYRDNHHRTYFTGPSRSEMERTGRTRVDVYKVNGRSRPGRTEVDRGTVSFYKPEVDNSRETRSRSMPSSYMRTNQGGKNEIVVSRRERPNEYTERKFENTQPRETGRTPHRSDLQNSLPAERNVQRDDRNDDFERFKNRESERTVRDQQNYDQRREQMERRTPDRSQNGQRQIEQSNQNGQRQRANETPSINRNSTQQRQPQIQRSASQQKSNQQVRSTGSQKKSSSRRRTQ